MKVFIKITAVTIISMSAFLWGVQFHKHHVFPYALAKAIQLHLFPQPVSSNQFVEQKAKILAAFKRPVDVVMIGDSITETAEWGDLFPETVISNHGISGDTVYGLAARSDDIVALRTKKAFILLGINDIAMGRAVKDILSDYLTVIKKLSENGSQVYIQSIIFYNTKLASEKFVYGDAIAKIMAVNANLEQLAKKTNLVYIDLNSKLANNMELNPLYTYDGQHLNAEGYKIWKSEIEKFVTQP